VTDQTAPYLAAIVIVMFLAGCVLIVVSLRDRLREATAGSDLWTQEPIGRREVSDELSNLRIKRATSIRGLITFRKPLSAGLDAGLCVACQC